MTGTCRHCRQPLEVTFCNLGVSPMANSYVAPDRIDEMEPHYPLHAFVCGTCFLVQLAEFNTASEIFSHYAYLASYSQSWVEHSRRYAEKVIRQLGLSGKSHVVEIASNDGYLLQFFKKSGIPCIGVEPAANVAEIAKAERGIDSIVEFFGAALAREMAATGARADLLIGNNVLAHVPDLNDFVEGLSTLLAPDGVITMEFPHVLRLIENSQFDTIYHEHFSYLSLGTTETVFARFGLTIYDVEELPTHGGSLRIYAKHADCTRHPISDDVSRVRALEARTGLYDLSSYAAFGEKAMATKRALLRFLIEAREAGKTVAGYGAPAKGNTLLNYCGIRTDFIDYTVDRNPLKQGYLLPGTRIPIHPPERLSETRPDYVLILPWNLADEIVAQLSEVREWGGQFVVPIPEVEVLA